MKLQCLIFFMLLIAPTTSFARKCTGSANCAACTNCSRCKYCNSGGTCGVCDGNQYHPTQTYSTKSKNTKTYQPKTSSPILPAKNKPVKTTTNVVAVDSEQLKPAKNSLPVQNYQDTTKSDDYVSVFWGLLIIGVLLFLLIKFGK